MLARAWAAERSPSNLWTVSCVPESNMSQVYDGQHFRRGEHGYERARRAAVWNARAPERFPEEIVIAQSETDVVRAVRSAIETDVKIGVRSGGHSWAGNHVRDGVMLLDLSRLRAVAVDRNAMTAVVEPGRPGSELLATRRAAAQQRFRAARHPAHISPPRTGDALRAGVREPRRAAAGAVRPLRARRAISPIRCSPRSPRRRDRPV
jgi:FAD/FMN-containing dehydrogenase